MNKGEPFKLNCSPIILQFTKLKFRIFYIMPFIFSGRVTYEPENKPL